MKKLAVRLVVLALVAVAVVYGAILLWTKVINKPEDELSTDDLSAALVEPTVTTVTAVTTGATGATDTVAEGVSGVWVATSESTLGYRVKEVLGGVDTEGVGRTSAVDGSITIDGTVVVEGGFSVEVGSIKSDSSRRDGQFTGRIMDAATFPTASFVITQPIDFGSIPTDGQQITVDATGDLTLRGSTKTVTFPLTAEYSNGRVGVFGNIPIVFAEYGIPNPSNQFVTTGDDGLLEFVLVFERG
ncbi:MAG: YceI family protein [Actinobacteria bacterium]|nr:YceI family protein [Actinomycetota bacterium]